MNELLLKLKELGVEEGDKSNSIVELITNMVKAETEVGKEYYRTKDNEAKGLRTDKNALSDILTKLGVDPATTNIDEYLSSREKETNQTAITLDSLNDALSGVKAELQSEKDLRATEYKDRVKANAQTLLTEKLAPQIYGSKGTIIGMLASGDLAMDGDNVTIGGLGIDDVVANYVKNNPDDLRANQEGGSGFRQDPPKGTKNLNDMSLAEVMSQ